MNGTVLFFWFLFAVALIVIGLAIFLNNSGMFVPTVGVGS